MKQKLGAVGFLTAIIGFMGTAGGVENLPADAGLAQWATLFGIFVTSAMLAQFSIWMIKDEI